MSSPVEKKDVWLHTHGYRAKRLRGAYSVQGRTVHPTGQYNPGTTREGGNRMDFVGGKEDSIPLLQGNRIHFGHG